jgi:PAS domain S-box-containing protein
MFLSHTFFQQFNLSRDYCAVFDPSLQLVHLNDAWSSFAGNKTALDSRRSYRDFFHDRLSGHLQIGMFKDDHQFSTCYSDEYSTSNVIHWTCLFDMDSQHLLLAGVEKKHDWKIKDKDRFESHFRLTNDLLIISTLTGETIELNEQWSKVLGFSMEELYAQSVTTLIHPDDLEASMEEAKGLIAENRYSTGFVNRYRHKNGSYKSLEWNASADLEKGIYYSVARDITERVAADKKARRYAQIVEASVNEIYRFGSTDLKFKEVNPAALKNLGYSIQEMLSMTPLDIKPELSPEEFNNILSQLESTQQRSLTLQSLHRRKNGTTYPTEIHLQKVGDDYVAFILDITRRDTIEKQLKESERRVPQIADSIPGALICFTQDESGQFSSVFMSSQIEEIMEIDASDAHQNIEILWNCFSKEDKGRLLLEIENSKKNSSAFDFSGKIKTVESHDKWLRITGNCKPLENGSTLWDAIITNITKSKDTEKELIQTIAEKTALFKELHHRIKNNLQMVNSLLYLKADEFDQEDVKLFIRETQSRIKSIAKIHERLLILQEMNTLDTKVYFDELIDDLVESLAVQPQLYSISKDLEEMQLHLDTVLPLALIITEILSNIVKHAYPKDQGGPITISISQRKGLTSLTISDQGVGAPDSHDLKASTGIIILRELVKQINAEMELSTEGGFSYRITF